MTSVPKKPQQALSKVLVEGFPDAGMFEDIPKIRKIAGESNDLYGTQSLNQYERPTKLRLRRMKDKVIIVTGTQYECRRPSLF